MEPFHLSLDRQADTLRVVSFEGTEALNRLYHFDIRVSLHEATAGFDAVALQTAACFTLRVDGGPLRTVYGLIVASQAIGATKSGEYAFSLRLGPRMALLKYRRSSRVFQDLTTQQIVDRVLDLSNIQRTWRLTRTLPKRTYCVQYDETDYAFVARLLIEEGIFFGFDHSAESPPVATHSEVLVLMDAPEHYAPIDGNPEIAFRAPTEGGGLELSEHHANRFAVQRATRSTGVLLRAFDIEKPELPRRDAWSSDGLPRVDKPEAMRTMVDRTLSVYEHGNAREQALLDRVPAKVFLEAEQAGQHLGRGESLCRRLLPGRYFKLIDHDISDLDGEYAVTRVDHEGYAPESAPPGKPVYKSRFQCIPRSRPARARQARRRVKQTLETATVVGPPNESIHTDELARVKVRFHWDLAGHDDEQSSCWLRVAQAWAGAGWGTQFIPRVGMEVLVSFVGGDPDRPIITGAAYNGTHPPPFALPEHKTQSGIRTLGVPGGAGSSELLFDDLEGSQLVALRSQKSLALGAVADARIEAGDRFVLSVAADHIARVGGSHTETVGGDSVRAVAASNNIEVGGNDASSVAGDRLLRVSGKSDEAIRGDSNHQIGGSRMTFIGDQIPEGGYDITAVAGTHRVSAGGEMQLSSQRSITLSCGKSSILLLPDRMVLTSPLLQIQAEKEVSVCQGDPPSASLVLAGSASLSGGTVHIASGEKATLVLDADAKLDGALVKLNCGPGSAAAAHWVEHDGPEGDISFEVLRAGFPPDVSSVTLVIAGPDGTVVKKQCLVGGTVTLQGPVGGIYRVIDTLVDEKPIVMRKVHPSASSENK